MISHVMCDGTSESRTFRLPTRYGEVTLRLTAAITGSRSPKSKPLIEWNDEMIGTNHSSVIHLSVDVEFEFQGENARLTDAVGGFFMILWKPGQGDWRSFEEITFRVERNGQRYNPILFNQSGEFLPDSDELRRSGLKLVRITA